MTSTIQKAIGMLKDEHASTEAKLDGLTRALEVLKPERATNHRHLSKAARQRIAAAPRLRWAKMRRANK